MGNDELDEMNESIREVMSLDGDVGKLRSYYGNWASSYDDDVASHGYGLPTMMVRTVEAGLTELAADDARLDRAVRVLDAGCGTGLVGASLADAGFDDIHGVDLSHEMIEQARRRGVYLSLEGGVDLSETAPDHLVRSADVVTVGGVFTVGHVAPAALRPMASLARTGGLLVVSTRDAYNSLYDFAGTVDKMCGSGVLRTLVHEPDAPYTKDSNGDYWAFEVL